MANVILYTRVSTDEQAVKGTSILYQQERLHQFCSLQGHNVIKYFAEDYSAKNFEDRPEFHKLLDFLKVNKGTVQKLLVLRWDRFSRNAPEAYNMIAKLAKLGIEVNAVEQPIDFSVPEQKMMLSFYLTIPEIENDRRAINVTNGMRKNMRDGRWVCTAPSGYTYSRDEQKRPILIKSEKANIVKKAFELFATENYPIDVLRKKMNEKGLKLGRDAFWKMLRNPIYIGKIKIKAYRNEPEEIVNGIHEPIVSEELFNEVQRILQGKKKVRAKFRVARHEFPMRGYLVCNLCGKNLTASASMGNGGKYYYYHCQPGCRERIEAKEAHKYFNKWVDKLVPKPQIVDTHLEIIERTFNANETNRKAETIKFEKAIQSREEMLGRAAKKLVNDELDKDSYRKLKDELTKECAELRAKIYEINNADKEFMDYADYGMRLLADLSYYYNKATLQSKQVMLGSIFSEKLVFNGNSYRTAEPSELISFLYRVDKGSKGHEKRKTAYKSSLSAVVDCLPSISNFFLKDMQLINELMPFIEIK